jgi:hypothetical protein
MVQSDWMNRVFLAVRTKAIRGPDVAVAAVLRECMDNTTTEAWPGRQRLAKDSGFSVRSVEGSIRRLEAAGLLRVQRSKGTHNRYWAAFPPAQEVRSNGAISARSEVVHTGAGGAPVVAQEVRHNGSTSAGGAPVVAQEVRHTGAGGAPELLKELTVDPSFGYSRGNPQAPPTKPPGRPAGRPAGQQSAFVQPVAPPPVTTPPPPHGEDRAAAAARLTAEARQHLDEGMAVKAQTKRERQRARRAANRAALGRTG